MKETVIIELSIEEYKNLEKMKIQHKKYKTALSEICDMIHRCDICTEMRMKAINAFKEFV